VSRAAALLIFAKVPRPGVVKTRLVPPLTPDAAAALSDAFLRDALDAWTRPDVFGLGAPVAVRLYLDGEAAPDGLPLNGATLHAQRGDGLGARMLRAFVEAFAAGFERVVIVGTDHPTLPVAFVGEAFRALAAPFTCVLGPSDDGGYYLLGLNELAPALFEGMTYSHAAVFDETLARALEAGLQPVLLPPWYDVDTPEALRRLLGEAEDDVPPRTRAALARLRKHPGLT